MALEEIHTDEGYWPFEELGPVKARVTGKTIFSKPRTIDEVDESSASRLPGWAANGVVGVDGQAGHQHELSGRH